MLFASSGCLGFVPRDIAQPVSKCATTYSDLRHASVLESCGNDARMHSGPSFFAELLSTQEHVIDDERLFLFLCHLFQKIRGSLIVRVPNAVEEHGNWKKRREQNFVRRQQSSLCRAVKSHYQADALLRGRLRRTLAAQPIRAISQA
jgi:hypothetical protein